jgi:hypothetical protein
VGPTGLPQGREPRAGTRMPWDRRRAPCQPGGNGHLGPGLQHQRGSQCPQTRPRPTSRSHNSLPKAPFCLPTVNTSTVAEVRAPPRGGVRRASRQRQESPQRRNSRENSATPRSGRDRERKGGALNGGGWFCAGSGSGAGAIVLLCGLPCFSQRPRTRKRQVAVWLLPGGHAWFSASSGVRVRSCGSSGFSLRGSRSRAGRGWGRGGPEVRAGSRGRSSPGVVQEPSRRPPPPPLPWRSVAEFVTGVRGRIARLPLDAWWASGRLKP